MNLQPIFEMFRLLLGQRLEAGVFTTEDSIRYTFCYAVTAAGRNPADLILEHPHPVMPGAEIDTIICGAAGQEAIALEFKYDRGNPGGTNQNRTQRAAAACADMFRLAKVPPSLAPRRYFVYVTDGEMAAYFRNPKNRLADIFEKPDGARVCFGLSALAGTSATFMARVAQVACDCYVSRVYAAELPARHMMRVWEVAV